jgi:CheY-like chemotaxis protein
MTHQHLNILIADDDEEDLELFEDAIHNVQPGTQVEKLTNGKAVLKHLDEKKDDELPCLIILDYNMPELTGSQVLSQLCRESRYKKIPKLILSTSSTPTHIDECLANGATEYFVKPDNINDLRSLAKTMLEYCSTGYS